MGAVRDGGRGLRQMATKTVDVEIEKLLLDEVNPRFGKPLSQDDMLARFAADPKTQKLAAHIAANGINPLDSLAVVAAPGKAGRYVVKEGNRRLSAIKLLNNQHLATEDRLVSKYRTISKSAKKNAVPQRMTCVVFAKATDAEEWMLVKHGGQLDGAGTVEWDGIQRGRFNLRSGRNEQYGTAIGFLDEAIDHQWISEDDASEVNISSLARVLNDKTVQKDLRIQVESGLVTFGLAKDGPERLAKRLVSDWRKESGLRVEEIYDQDKRKAYAARLRAELDLEDGAGTSSAKRTKASRSVKKSKGQSLAGSRKGIVPRSYQISFPTGSERVAAILTEMKRLDTHKFPNASAVIFRTFFEISVHHYLKKNAQHVNQSDTLKALTERAISHLQTNHQKPNDVKDAVKPVRAGFSAPHSLFGIQTLHDYVHHPKRHPLPSELRSQWDNFSDFLKLLWD
jgi:hypothetical protein